MAGDLTPKTAAAVFSEAKAMSDRDGGRLWGQRLYGPMLLVDRTRHFAIADVADPQGVLKPTGGVFAGELPQGFLTSNSAIDWEGLRWTTINWPLPDNAAPRRRLEAHELFHRIEPALGIAVMSPANAHLDTLKGRYWLFLELRALHVALLTRGVAQTQAIRDALGFRAVRLAAFAQGTAEEDTIEANEGLAEYTGVVASTDDAVAAQWQAVAGITGLPVSEGVSKSFAYATGPAWGVLLDRRVPGWRSKVSSAGFVAQLATAFPARPGWRADDRAIVYGGKALLARETERAARADAFAAGVRAKFLTGTALVIGLTDKVNYSFDPYDVTAIGDGWSYYTSLTVSDAWGKITITGGALFSPNRHELRIVPPPASALEGGPEHVATGDWTLDLLPGWEVSQAADHFAVVRK